MRELAHSRLAVGWSGPSLTCCSVIRKTMDAEEQTDRVLDHFRGHSARLNYDRLVLYAEKRLARAWLTGSPVSIQPAAHYVNEAVKRCLPGADGNAVRDIDRTLPIDVLLKGIIRSIISNDLYPSDVRRRTCGSFTAVEDHTGTERHLTADDFSESFWDDGRRGEQIRESAVRAFDDDPLLESFMNFLRRDAIVHKMVTLLLEEDVDEPAQLIAQKIGTTVASVYLARRRLSRLIRHFRQRGKN